MMSTPEGLQPADWKQILDHLPAIRHASYFDHFGDVEFTFDTLEDVIDSSDMKPESWVEVANRIRDHYDNHDGFVILHGTDTMAFTACALSYMLANLAKPVVLTGAQLPVFHTRTDAVVNLSNAIYVAAYQVTGLPCIPEVVVCFNDKLWRGNRTVKSSTNDFEGFSSPNYVHLARLEQHIHVNRQALLKPGEGSLNIIQGFSNQVVSATIFPGYKLDALQDLVVSRKIKGVVLNTFGAGNLPSYLDWDRFFLLCKKNEVLILAITQSVNGSIESGRYKSGKALSSHDVINGMDLTSEAALTKLMWVIGNFDYLEAVEMCKHCLRGEFTEHN